VKDKYMYMPPEEGKESFGVKKAQLPKSNIPTKKGTEGTADCAESQPSPQALVS